MESSTIYQSCSLCALMSKSNRVGFIAEKKQQLNDKIKMKQAMKVMDR